MDPSVDEFDETSNGNPRRTVRFSTTVEELLREDDRLADEENGAMIDQSNLYEDITETTSSTNSAPVMNKLSSSSSSSPSKPSYKLRLLPCLQRSDILRMSLFVLVFVCFSLPGLSNILRYALPMLYDTTTARFSSSGIIVIACLAAFIYNMLLHSFAL